MEGRELGEKICAVLYEKKARNIVLLDVAESTIITEYMVIASGRSYLQTRSLADDVDDAAAQWGAVLKGREGKDEGKWIVLDYGNVVVHLFHPEHREFYRLEKLWDRGDNRIPLPFDSDDEGVQDEA